MRSKSIGHVKNSIVVYTKVIMLLLLNIFLGYQVYCYSIHRDALYFL